MNKIKKMNKLRIHLYNTYNIKKNNQRISDGQAI